MNVLFAILRLAAALLAAWLIGRLSAKLRLPAILGWLIAGMLLGPHALGLLDAKISQEAWFETAMHVMECAVGLMIGTELVWSKLKKSGKAIFITTLFQSLGTFLAVSLVFAVVFWFAKIPLYLAFLFGAIALATAPAPALSIVREFHTSGPVTQTLIPMAALDDIVGCIVFFTVVSLVSGHLSAGTLSPAVMAVSVILPLVLGAAFGVLAGFILRKEASSKITLLLLGAMILAVSAAGLYFNEQVMPEPLLNFMLIGMAFSAVFANMVSEERLEQIMNAFNPVLGICMIAVIVNLGAGLDYHLIIGAGFYTLIYIAARAFGKYFGAYLGAKATGSPDTVRKYLGLTLLPHSGVSLVFTGIAVSALAVPAPEEAKILQGTIAAAAVINEIIAVLTARKGFEWAGELNQQEQPEALKESA